MISWILEAWTNLPTGAWLIMIFVFASWSFLGWCMSPIIIKIFEGKSAGYIEWMVFMFDRMFMRVSGRRCMIMILASMAFSFCLGFVLTMGLPVGTGYNVVRLIIATMLALGFPKLPTGYNFPRLAINYMWDRRIHNFEIQMMDALTFMSNGLKSGLSLIQSMDMVKDEMDNPIGEEFSLVLSQQRLGIPLEEALLGLEDRIGTEDVQIMVTSINILRQSGGNLTETFDTIAETVRERKKVEGRISTLTAQGRAQGIIITLMPFVLAAVLYTMEPTLIQRLWKTPIGLIMLMMMLGLQFMGAWMIKKTVEIEV